MKEIDKDGIKSEEDGIIYYKFWCEYIMPDGTEWSFDIWAKDWEDADERIKMIKLTLRNGGQVMGMADSED